MEGHRCLGPVGWFQSVRGAIPQDLFRPVRDQLERLCWAPLRILKAPLNAPLGTRSIRGWRGRFGIELRRTGDLGVNARFTLDSVIVCNEGLDKSRIEMSARLVANMIQDVLFRPGILVDSLVGKGVPHVDDCE